MLSVEYPVEAPPCAYVPTSNLSANWVLPVAVQLGLPKDPLVLRLIQGPLRPTTVLSCGGGAH